MWTKLIVILGFAISFSAGLAVGLGGRSTSIGMSPPPTSGPTSRRSHGPESMLKSVLNLTPEQQDQMRKIWSETANRGEQEDKRRQLRKERDESIAALIRGDDRAAYESVLAKYSEQMNVLEQESRTAYDTAVKKTSEILTPDQRTKYEELLKRNQWDRGGPRPGPHGPGGPEGPGPNGPGPSGQGPGGQGPRGPGPDGSMQGGFNREDVNHHRGAERAATRPAVEK